MLLNGLKYLQLSMSFLFVCANAVVELEYRIKDDQSRMGYNSLT